MEIIIQKNLFAASQEAAGIVADLLLKKPNAVIGLASGESPKCLYDLLVKHENQGKVDFTGATFFALDEYIGLGADSLASYSHYYEACFFGQLKNRPQKIFLPDGRTENVEQFCANYEKRIRDCSGIDLQILGIGRQGHLGFNEPGSSLASRMRIKTLTPETLKANRKALSGLKDPPRHVLTMGLGTILDAKRCVVLGFGQKKARAIAGMVEGPISASLPASILQMHPQTYVFLDPAAAKLLKRKKYYQFIYDHKPDWQRTIRV